MLTIGGRCWAATKADTSSANGRASQDKRMKTLLLRKRLCEKRVDLRPGVVRGGLDIGRVLAGPVHRPHEAVAGAFVDIDLLHGLSGRLERFFKFARARGGDAFVVRAEDAENG